MALKSQYINMRRKKLLNRPRAGHLIQKKMFGPK